MISPHVFDRARELASQFAHAQPFRHVEIDSFLEPVDCQRILDAFPKFSERHAMNEMGIIGNKAVRTDVGNLDAVFSQLDATVRSREFLDLVSTITGIPDLLYDPDYVGGGTHENRHGQALSPHVDFNILPGRRWHRRLNLIIYLNPKWEAAWGGCIELYRDPWEQGETETRRFLPLFNKCVIFETNEQSWHGFETIQLPETRHDLTRKSFAIYLYTEQRPQEETAASHATVYVPKGMPSFISAGSLLSDANYAELRNRFTQLLGQLKFLYGRELEFSAHVDALAASLSNSSAHARFDLQGYAIQGGGVVGIWSDGWMATDMRTSFTPTLDASALDLAVWIPEQFAGPQVLAIRLGATEQQLTVLPGEVAQLTIECPMPAGGNVPFEVRASSFWKASSESGNADDRALGWRVSHAKLRHD